MSHNAEPYPEMIAKSPIVALMVIWWAGNLFTGAEAAGGIGHSIPPVDIDLSPAWGLPPDGNAEFQVTRELLEVPYQGIPRGTEISTDFLGWRPLPTFGVTVFNLLDDWTVNAVLTVENYGVFFGDPSGWIFLYETVWNPPALATGDIPAYPLGDISPGGSRYIEVAMIPGFELPIFDGEFDAESFGFNSTGSVPGFSDASVLLVPEPATLSLLALGGLLVTRRR